VKSLEFHNTRGDFEKWAEKSLRDTTLFRHLKKIRLSKLTGEPLRKALNDATKQRFDELKSEARAVTKYF
jgi:hypothetical protein